MPAAGDVSSATARGHSKSVIESKLACISNLGSPPFCFVPEYICLQQKYYRQFSISYSSGPWCIPDSDDKTMPFARTFVSSTRLDDFTFYRPLLLPFQVLVSTLLQLSSAFRGIFEIFIKLGPVSEIFLQ